MRLIIEEKEAQIVKRNHRQGASIRRPAWSEHWLRNVDTGQSVGLEIHNIQRAAFRMNVVTDTKCQRCSIGRPSGISLNGCCRSEELRQAAIGRDQMNLPRLAGKGSGESEALAIGRPMRNRGPLRSVSELQTI